MGNIMSHFNPTTALQHNGGFKPLIPLSLTKNFKEIKCSLINHPFLPIALASLDFFNKLSYISPLQRKEGVDEEKKQEWEAKKSGKRNLLEIISK